MSLYESFELTITDVQDRVEFEEPQECVLTDATHVSISGDVTINGIDLRHHTHLYRCEDGSWKTKSEIQDKPNHS